MPFRVQTDPLLSRKLAAAATTTTTRVEIAERISRLAEQRTKGTDSKRSHRVEVDRGRTPPRVAAVAGTRGGVDRAFIFIFQEFGGEGFRPPPAPLRTAAQRVAHSTK